MICTKQRRNQVARGLNRIVGLGLAMGGLGVTLGSQSAYPQSRDASELQGQQSVFKASTYNPAILSLSFSVNPGSSESVERESDTDSLLDIVLITREGRPIGRRVILSKEALQEELQKFYRQLARQEKMNTGDPQSPARRLHHVLIEPIESVLRENAITTLVIAAERGLQAVPYAALHNGVEYFGRRFAFSVTPSLQLTSLGPPKTGKGRMLAAGASEFPELAPLPLVEQELERVDNPGGVDRFLNKDFTPEILLGQVTESDYQYVHIATHAEFLPGGPEKARIYSGRGAIAISEFSDLRQRRNEKPIDLFSLSACRTAVGDRDSELGFAGLALQAGAKSAAGSLWYVDDIATSAFFIQFYRYLREGMPKAESMQQVRVDILTGRLRLEGDAIMGTGSEPLLTGLTKEQKRRMAGGIRHPFFWAGIELLGVPW